MLRSEQQVHVPLLGPLHHVYSCMFIHIPRYNTFASPDLFSSRMSSASSRGGFEVVKWPLQMAIVSHGHHFANGHRPTANGVSATMRSVSNVDRPSKLGSVPSRTSGQNPRPSARLSVHDTSHEGGVSLFVNGFQITRRGGLSRTCDCKRGLCGKDRICPIC